MANNKPDVMELVQWLRGLTNPVEGLREATLLIDQVRSELLPELASARRGLTWEARQQLISQGMSTSDATRKLAELVGASPQTVMRLIGERISYGAQ